MPADIVFVNGIVIPIDPAVALEAPEAVAVTGNTITAASAQTRTFGRRLDRTHAWSILAAAACCPESTTTTPTR